MKFDKEVEHSLERQDNMMKASNNVKNFNDKINYF